MSYKILLMICALLIGGAVGIYRPECPQAVNETTEVCDCCTPGVINGPPPAGWVFQVNTSSCVMDEGDCPFCCVNLDCEVSGTDAAGCQVNDCDSGTQSADFTGTLGHFIVYTDLISECLEDSNTFACAEILGVFAGGMKTRCFRLDCRKCVGS